MSARESLVVACSGGFHCPAEKHIHGCFADKGNCDHPQEHRRADILGRPLMPRYPRVTRHG